jgi:exopolyphosphatase/guanosine-5'-triphosphate,3'-diphosphate pyrophosphatase
MDDSFSAMPDTPAAPPALRLAAIDIGTNSIRLVVAEVQPDGGYSMLAEEREMTRLGHGLFDRGRLTNDAMDRAIAALTKMKTIADGFGVAELRAVATSAVREASNGRAFCQEVRRRCGLRVEVITGEEEAQLALRSATRHFDLDGRAVAIVDIGGGSMEVTLAAGPVVDEVVTLPLGAVRLTEAFGTDEALSRKRWRKLRRAIDRTLAGQIGRPVFRPEMMIGSGGTFTNLAELARAERGGSGRSIQGYALSRADVVHTLRRLRTTPLAQRRQIQGLNPKRADIIVAGAAAVARLAKWLGTGQILVNAGGVRDGLLLTMIAERLPGEQVEAARPKDRMESVRAFARKCRSNEPHCERVALLAGQIFDGLHRRFEIPAEARDLLVAAALMHDVGNVINHAKHHKHAYHLILHGDFQGFSPRETEVIANVARYHRKAVPSRRHDGFALLDKSDRRLVRALAGILRVADSLDRTHTQRVTGVTGVVRGAQIRLEVAAATDPQVEIWDAERRSGLFEIAFGSAPRMAWRRDDATQRATARTPLRLAAAG